jgi:hypothetical protein
MAEPHSRAPWFVWTSLASVTCILAGAYWDISWHMTIGRDSFWTPAHLAIQLGGIVAGVSGSYQIFSTTLRRSSPLRDTSIGVLGFRGPFGAYLAVWGAATMVVSAPFDNWWHSAYGLDVKILSPPHAVLTLGILGVASGGVLQVLAVQNRATGAARIRLEWILLVIGGEVLVLTMTALLEHTFRSNLHRADAYRAISLVAPLMILAMAHASNRRWAATMIAGVYTLFMVGMVWLFPLFPAEAKLGPVYQPISHFIPLEFPMLVIAPAIAMDLIRDKLRERRRWQQAIVLGAVFLVVLVAAEWPFASFLQSDAAKNWVFGTMNHPYFLPPDTYGARNEFFPETTADFWRGMAQGLGAAVVTSWIGLVIGDAMRKVRR